MGRTAVNVSGSMTAGTVTSRLLGRTRHGQTVGAAPTTIEPPTVEAPRPPALDAARRPAC